jgi:hypothetical protein
MISYAWSVEKLVVADGNVVTHVHWRCTGTQDNLNASCNGVRKLVPVGDLIPYAQLTEAQVLDWCFAEQTIEIPDFQGNISSTVVRLLKNYVENQIAEQLAEQALQKTFEPALPWA